MRIINSFGALAYEQTTKLRPGDRTWYSLTKGRKAAKLWTQQFQMITEKEDEKVEKTLLEKSEGCGGSMRAKVVPVVIGALGSVPLKVSLKAQGVDTSISLIQKSASLESARILRGVLEM